jgi:hypothetical protein
MRIAALVTISAALASAGGALATVGSQPSGSTAQSLSAGPGLVGYVSRGPISATCLPGTSCFHPARVMLRFSQNGSEAIVARRFTSASGAYRVALKPGLYTVTAPLGVSRLIPSIVRVPVSGWRHVNFVLLAPPVTAAGTQQVRPALRVIAPDQPVIIEGVNFKASEQVRVTGHIGTTTVDKSVVSSVSGTFMINLGNGVHLAGCSAGAFLTATGTLGSVATLKILPRLCAP